MIYYKYLRKTLLKCPSQWEGISNNNENIYIRYRWGYLTLYLDDKEIYYVKCGDNYEGEMRTKKMLEILKDYIKRIVK